MKGVTTSLFFIGLYILLTATVVTAIKCSGAWSNHACFGGNGKRGHGLEKLLLSRLHSKRNGNNGAADELQNKVEQGNHLIRDDRGKPRQNNKNQFTDGGGDDWLADSSVDNNDAYYDSYYNAPWKRVIEKLNPSVFKQAREQIQRRRLAKARSQLEPEEENQLAHQGQE